MAGTSLGAASPASPPSLQLPSAGARRVLGVTRTRRNHGVFLIGNELACIYSSRRAGDAKGVQLVLGTETPVFSGSVSQAQARAIARALIAAADSIDEVETGRS